MAAPIPHRTARTWVLAVLVLAAAQQPGGEAVARRLQRSNDRTAAGQPKAGGSSIMDVRAASAI